MYNIEINHSHLKIFMNCQPFWRDEKIRGTKITIKQEKLSLYTNDVIVFLDSLS